MLLGRLCLVRRRRRQLFHQRIVAATKRVPLLARILPHRRRARRGLMLKLGRVVHPPRELTARASTDRERPRRRRFVRLRLFLLPPRVRRPRDAPRRRSVRLHLGLERFHLSLLLSHPSHELVVLLLLRRNLRILGAQIAHERRHRHSRIASFQSSHHLLLPQRRRIRRHLTLESLSVFKLGHRLGQVRVLLAQFPRLVVAAAHLGGERLRGEFQRRQLILLLSQLPFHLLVRRRVRTRLL